MHSLAGRHVRGTLRYGVHFGLLGCAALVLALSGPWRPHGILVSFATYGALHSTMTTLSLRAATSWVRGLGFVVFAACLSMLSVLLGLGIQRGTAAFPGVLSPYLLAAFCSGVGAFSYAWLVRHFWIEDLRCSAMAVMAVGCMMATYAALVMLDAPQALGGFWPAAAWWLAFSTGLGFYDLRRERRHLRADGGPVF